MKNHGTSAHPFIVAPLYIIGIVLGMVALVMAMGGRSRSQNDTLNDAESAATSENDKGLGSKKRPSITRSISEAGPSLTNSFIGSISSEKIMFASGILFSLSSGTCDMFANGLVNAGKKIMWRHAGCEGQPSLCPEALINQFDVFGSWMASFGTAAMVISALYMSALWTYQRRMGLSESKMHLKIMLFPGNAAGLLWCLGYLFQLKALTRGGSAVMMPCNCCCSLICSGMWSLFYYRETEGLYRRCIWAAAVGFTLLMIVLLVREKDTRPVFVYGQDEDLPEVMQSM